MAMLEIVSGAVPVFVTVTVWAALGTPTATFPKLKDVAERPSSGAVPVPVTDTVCGLPVALLIRVSVPARAPTAVGVKMTEIAHVALTAMLGVQPELVWEKSPPIDIFEIASAAVPVFVTVKVWAALDAPTTMLPKLSVVAESDTTGAVGVEPPVELKFPAPHPVARTATRAKSTGATPARLEEEETGLDRRFDKKSTSVERDGFRSTVTLSTIGPRQ